MFKNNAGQFNKDDSEAHKESVEYFMENFSDPDIGVNK